MRQARSLLGRVLVVVLPCVILAAGTRPALAQRSTPAPAVVPGEVVQAQRASPSHASEPGGLHAFPLRKAGYPLGDAASRQPVSAPAPQSRPLTGILPAANQEGLKAGGASPSDSTGAIGTNHYIEMVNNQVGMFDRTLVAPLSTVPLATFVAAPAGFGTGDPQIQWDEQGGRWLYAVLLVNFSPTPPTPPNDFRIAFGWSKAGDLNTLTLNNTDWCNFNVDTLTNLYDYPKLGHDANFIEIGANVFPNGGNFGNSAVMVMAKPAAGDTSCTAPAPKIFNLGASFTPIPGNTTDVSSTAIAYTVAINTTFISVFHAMTTAIGTCTLPPCFVRDGNIAITPWTATTTQDFTVPQPAGAQPIDALEGRLTQAVQHSDPSAGGAEAVWTQHTTGSPSGRTVVTWYELLPGMCTSGCPAAAKRQEGTLSSPTLSLFNAAISPNSRGDAAVIHYNTGSATTFVDVRAQRRDGADPLNTMSGELVLRESTVADTDLSCTSQGGPPCRWGDYAGASPDPTDCSLVWGSSMLSGTVASTGPPTWVTQNFALGEGMVQTAVSTQQYALANSDGKTWLDMDPTQLRLGATRCANTTAVITANTDLFTTTNGVNQDIAIFVDIDGVAATAPLGWKESGGLNGTFSPNAAYLQTMFPMTNTHSYTVRLKWKANGPTAGTIFAGAGPLPGGAYSPTRLTIQYYATAPLQSVNTSTQPKLAGNDGATWVPVPGVASIPINPVSSSRVLFGGNGDLWTETAGINQDIGIMLDGTLIAWKESGGVTGTFSPNAAFVQATANVTAGSHTAQLVWKTNQATSATIHVGAGPLADGTFSPTSLLAVVLPAGSNPLESINTNQLSLYNSDGATWGSMLGIQLSIAPSVSMYAVVGANADLWTLNTGYNQDIAIFVSDNGKPDQLLVWKESGGTGGPYSPNAAFAEVVVPLTGGHSYVFKLTWKTNSNSNGAWIKAGAGPLIGGAYSPTRLVLKTV